MFKTNLVRTGAALLTTAGLFFAADKLTTSNTVLAADVTQQPGTAKPAAKRPNKPNILLIVADDLGYSDLSLYGSEIPTPNIDALARNGMLLDTFYAGLTCSPTRSMLLSGTDNHLAGVGVMGAPTRAEHKDQPGYVGYLNFRVASLAEVLGDAGYNTYMAGKWHLGSGKDKVETGPHARGFKQAFASFDGAAHLGGWDWRGPQDSDYYDNDNIVHVGDDWYTTRDYTRKMIGYIEADRKQNKPFFAYMAYTAPHWPLQAPAASIARFKGVYDKGYEAVYANRFNRMRELKLLPPGAEMIGNSRFNPRWDTLTEDQKKVEARHMEIYAAMVSDLDTYVGELITYLKSINEFDNTFIMFMSDNGAEAGRRDLAKNITDHIGKEYNHSVENLGAANSYVMYGANWASVSETPFNRHKATAFEGGNHVPAFVHFKGIKPGTHATGVSTVMDVMPTLLAIAGTKHPGTRYKDREVLPMTGVSMLPMLTGKAKAIHAENEILGFELFGYRSVRQGDWKITWDQAPKAEQRHWQLFNVAQDPTEQHDLAATIPDKLKEMLANWDRYARDNGVIY